ncbi:FAD-dependent oxidoreductase [Natrinema gelatinilyticum]|uniref:FAD-dependent oxidoreductase n=1 Tax=Natrinema gelatinilyticum TaxID=2961571 RepID=UPI0020C1D7A3|nr:FAD-dependent oxidoreductase [Natrinema gelatinilyticum]
MTANTATTDVAIVGAGMAGLVAGVYATELGADVIVLEKGSRPGGSMYLSAGLVWSYETLAEARENVPGGDPTLQRVIVDGLDPAYDWLESLGVTVREPPVELPTGDTVTAPTPGANCGKIEPEEFTRLAREQIEEGGNEIFVDTPMTELRTDDGAVSGVVAWNETGRLEIDADAVILATGGFQGNERLLQEYVTLAIDDLWLRANPWSTGDGLLVARDVGARTTGGMHTFYGHNLAAPPAEVTPDEFLELTQYYGPFTVALDEHGERFTDESESDLEHTLAQDTAREADGRAYYVFDADLYDDEVFSMGHIGTIVERSAEAGANVIRAESLTEFEEELYEASVDGTTAVETLKRFNEAVRDGRADRLDPPRTDHQRTVDTPPFYAVPVQPGITFTMGGIAVDENARVIHERRSPSTVFGYDNHDEPLEQVVIPGLYAAGVDVGNVNNRHYMGGLANALVLGRVAAENAVAEATD